MDKRLLTILRCPITHRGLRPAPAKVLDAVNAAIADGQLATNDGRVLAQPFAAALVTDDGKVLYPVDAGIPVLLESEAVHMEQLG